MAIIIIIIADTVDQVMIEVSSFKFVIMFVRTNILFRRF